MNAFVFMCMHSYLYIYIYIYIYMFLFISIYIQMYLYMCMNVYEILLPLYKHCFTFPHYCRIFHLLFALLGRCKGKLCYPNMLLHFRFQLHVLAHYEPCCSRLARYEFYYRLWVHYGYYWNLLVRFGTYSSLPLLFLHFCWPQNRGHTECSNERTSRIPKFGSMRQGWVAHIGYLLVVLEATRVELFWSGWFRTFSVLCSVAMMVMMMTRDKTYYIKIDSGVGRRKRGPVKIYNITMMSQSQHPQHLNTH